VYGSSLSGTDDLIIPSNFVEREMLKELNFDEFISEIHAVFDNLPDYRLPSPNRQYSIKDAALAAFSMFFSQSPSFLSYQQAMQQAQGHNNAQSLFGVENIPSDNQIRNLLDPVAPEHIYPLFSGVFEALESHGHLESYRFWENYFLIPIDGTEYFRSSKIHCDNCSVTHHKNGKITYSHKALTPVLVTPNNSKVLSLEPEFVTPQDGAVKQDCELNAAKRWIERNEQLANKRVIILGDDLFSREPFCKLLLSKGFHFVLVCKPDSHKTLYEWVDSFEKSNDLNNFSTRNWNGRFHEHWHYRYTNQLPIKNGEDVLDVNWVELTITNTKTKEIMYKNAFVTDFFLDLTSVATIVQAGRSRWKVENENNNILKTKGYHLEHSYGHGKQLLSSTMVTLNLLAFLAHTFLEFVDYKYQKIRMTLAARKRFFHDFTTLTKYLFFNSWEHIMGFMFEQLKIPITG
jgi:hypothetical protein